MPVSKLVGARVKRREDPRLLRGLGHYVDDIRLIDTLCVTILRSPHAHAQIKGIHAQEALRHPGMWQWSLERKSVTGSERCRLPLKTPP